VKCGPSQEPPKEKKEALGEKLAILIELLGRSPSQQTNKSPKGS